MRRRGNISSIISRFERREAKTQDQRPKYAREKKLLNWYRVQQNLFPGEDGSWYLRKIDHGVGYPCQNCGKVYKHRGNMRRHVQYECGKPAMFQCTFCDRKFHQQSNLKRHFENKHRCFETGPTMSKGPSPLPTSLPKFSKSITVYRTPKAAALTDF
ncbi:hypothetical protein GWI33_014898 [Rhynchophorus ferrugineus]|uniref:C2H2-type domain-containing protein n=1 Tax=Rhynchophorus ferrugineus TaxID=354439 RepID=A0A834I1S6_RHYFE|nr:hypothetical protein GWI33_014898 [Rhynchophorus ferrugineus]